jgi:hypothetical protein
MSCFFHSRGACRTCPRAHTHFLRTSSLTSMAQTSSAVFSPQANTAVVAGASPAANRNPLPVLAFYLRLHGGVIRHGAAHVSGPSRNPRGLKNVVTTCPVMTASTANRAENGRRTTPRRAGKPPPIWPERPRKVLTNGPGMARVGSGTPAVAGLQGRELRQTCPAQLLVAPTRSPAAVCTHRPLWLGDPRRKPFQGLTEPAKPILVAGPAQYRRVYGLIRGSSRHASRPPPTS